MNEERNNPSSKKKFLYLDKFEKHEENQTLWEITTSREIKELKTRITGLIWIAALGYCLSAISFLIIVVHVMGQT